MKTEIDELKMYFFRGMVKITRPFSFEDQFNNFFGFQSKIIDSEKYKRYLIFAFLVFGLTISWIINLVIF